MRSVHRSWCLGLLAGLLTTPLAAQDDTSSVDLGFFEQRIRPVLVEHCYKCHSDEIAAPEGGLRVDSRSALRRGGESGEAVVPGHPEDSLLLQALRYEAYEMPPSGPLSDGIVADFERWIAGGAPDPRDTAERAAPRTIDIQQGRDYWAFQPPVAQAVPEGTDPTWPMTEVDRFIAAAYERQGLRPVADADPATLLRRVSLDLVGLPPTPEQLDNYLADPSPKHFEEVVDQLLDSPEFGERWGRHWLDLARYAESMGKTRNYPFPSAWRYRDYVINAFNEDLPYDQFIREQLAGDLMTSGSRSERERRLIATGFLAIGSHDLNERNRQAYQLDVAAEQIDTTFRSLLALTVGCARCHDHKFDPIPTTDYYALAGIFVSTQTMNGYSNRQGGGNQALRGDLLFSLAPEALDVTRPTADRTPPRRAMPLDESSLPVQLQERLTRLRAGIDGLRERRARLARNRQLGGQERQTRLAELAGQLERRQQQLERALEAARERLAESAPPQPVDGPVCMGVQEGRQTRDIAVAIGGDPQQRGATISRGFLSVIQIPDAAGPSSSGSGRLELAEWMANPQNPLTSRVLVNRVWSHLFGRGLVPTVDNFGLAGQRPTHPELLDYLALEFVQDGWSIKQLIRTLVTSRVYRLSTFHAADQANVDGDNAYYWRMLPKRLEFEVIRDSLLVVSSGLELEPPGGSPVQQAAEGELRGRQLLQLLSRDFPYRSVYLPIIRNRLPEMMTTFDFPDPSEPRGRRDVTTAAAQALFFLNDPLVMSAATRLGRQFAADAEDTDQRIRAAYRLILAREATLEEAAGAKDFLGPGRASATEWTQFFQALLASAEFRYCG